MGWRKAPFNWPRCIFRKPGVIVIPGFFVFYCVG